MNDKQLQDVGEKIVKRGRGRPVGTGGNERPDRSESLQVHTDPGDNTKYISFALLLRALPKVDMNSVEDVSERITKYFELCAEYDMKPGMAGLAAAFGYDRKSLWEYTNGRMAKNQEVSDTIKKAAQSLDLIMESYMQNGKINPISGIFLMKNNLNYSDKQEVVVTAQSPLGDTKDTKALEEKYGESVADE